MIGSIYFVTNRLQYNRYPEKKQKILPTLNSSFNLNYYLWTQISMFDNVTVRIRRQSAFKLIELTYSAAYKVALQHFEKNTFEILHLYSYFTIYRAQYSKDKMADECLAIYGTTFHLTITHKYCERET